MHRPRCTNPVDHRLVDELLFDGAHVAHISAYRERQRLAIKADMLPTDTGPWPHAHISFDRKVKAIDAVFRLQAFDRRNR